MQSRQAIASPRVIGLTGPIASGKSTIGLMLGEQGAEVIDADRVYHALIAPGALLNLAIVDRFGPGVLGEDGSLDRGKLGALVFHDPESMRALDRLTHPAIVQEVRNIIARSTASAVVVEAIKLAQSGLIDDVDELWFVVADPSVRKLRLIERGGIDAEAAQARIESSSISLPAGVEADVTIDTTDGIAATRAAVDQAWRAFSNTMALENR